jgi:hypothetical protein
VVKEGPGPACRIQNKPYLITGEELTDRHIRNEKAGLAISLTASLNRRSELLINSRSDWQGSMPPVTRSKCKCSEDKTEAVRPRNPPLTIFSDEEIARLEEHEERAQQYRHERVLSGGYDRISSNDLFLSTDPEAKSTSDGISLASPPPSTPYRPVALRGCDVLGLWNHLRNNKGNEKGGALGRIVKSFADWDLYKLPLVLWLMVSSNLEC